MAKAKLKYSPLTRKTVKVEVQEVDVDCQRLEDAIEYLKALREEYGPDALIENTQNRWDDGYTLKLFISRPETDEEFEASKAKRLEEIACLEEHERQQYAFLAAKYGDLK